MCGGDGYFEGGGRVRRGEAEGHGMERVELVESLTWLMGIFHYCVVVILKPFWAPRLSKVLISRQSAREPRCEI